MRDNLTNQPVFLLEFDAYVAITYTLENVPRAICVQSGLKDQLLAIPFSEEIAEVLETYYNPEKDFLVDPISFELHEKLALDSWLAEDWIYEEMLDKATRRLK